MLTVAAPGVLGNDADPDGDPLTAVLVTGPSHGTLTLNANGSFTYTPAADFTGSDSFSYRASDGTLTSNLATVTHHRHRASTTLRPRPGMPTARPRTPALTVTGAGVLGNDSDPDGDPLTAVLVIGAEPRHPDLERQRLVHLHARRRTSPAPTRSPTGPATAPWIRTWPR